MCVAMDRADFKGAIAFGGEVSRERHLLGYQNSAISYSGPNCMLLHVPMKGRLTAANLIPTTHAPNFLQDMAKSLESLDPPLRGSRGVRTLRNSTASIVPYGACDMVLANSASDIYDALEFVDPEKRPKANETLLSWFDHRRPGFGFLLPCFNNNVEEFKHPILVEYTPKNPDMLFVPGLESHNGRPPVLGDRGHPRDFKVVFGSLLGEQVNDTGENDDHVYTYPVNYTDNLGALGQLLPKQVVGFRDENVGTNSDYWASVSDVRRGLNYGTLFETMPEHANGATKTW